MLGLIKFLGSQLHAAPYDCVIAQKQDWSQDTESHEEDVTLLVFGSESLGRCNVATRAQQQSKAETVNLQGEGPMVLLTNVEVRI